MVVDENVRCFIYNGATIIGEQDHATSDEGLVKLKHPFRLILQSESTVSVAPLFIKEEWVRIPTVNALEIDVNEGMLQLYKNYESQIYSSIIAPPKGTIIT